MDRDFYGPSWADHHHRTSDAIARTIEKLRYAFVRLAQLQYDAPWERMPTPRPRSRA